MVTAFAGLYDMQDIVTASADFYDPDDIDDDDMEDFDEE